PRCRSRSSASLFLPLDSGTPGRGGNCFRPRSRFSLRTATAAQRVADAPEEPVEGVRAVEEGEHRPAADAQLLDEDEELRVVAVDLQAGADRLHRPLAVASQQIGAGEVEIVLRLVELDVDRVLAELEPLADPAVAQGNAEPQIGVEQAGEAFGRLPLLRHLPQVVETLVPVPSPAAFDPKLQGSGDLGAQGHLDKPPRWRTGILSRHVKIVEFI